MNNIYLVAVVVLSSLISLAQDDKNLSTVPVSTVLDQSVQYTEKKISLELFSYEEYLYSKSRKTEIGDKLKLNTRFRYQVNDITWMSLGFKTNPDRDRFDNKTSDFELRTGYNYENFIAQADFSLNTDDDNGSISVGLDLDSENTFLRYEFNKNFQFTFFPFNFDGKVGVEFQTYDVTRIYYIQGTPALIPLTPDPNDLDEKIANKTIPGFVFRYHKVIHSKNLFSTYAGLGIATYEYPNDPSFDVRSLTGSTSWSRNETFGYKFGGLLRKENSFTSFQFVGQTKDKETGVLTKSATSLYNLSYIGNRLILESEITASKGGRKPYRIDFSKNWFDTSDTLFQSVQQRIYSNIAGDEIQDWAGEWGYAGSFKLGLRKQEYTPYFSYKYQNKYFVFSGRESAQELRTNNLEESHGGLHRIGFGAYFYKENFIINPRFEYLISKNNVFSKSGTITDLSTLKELTNTDFIFFINISYFYNKKTGPRTFRL